MVLQHSSGAHAGALTAGVQAWLPEAAYSANSIQDVVQALPHPNAAFDLAQDTPIWENLVRYTQYFFSVMLGTAYIMLRPIAALLKRPVTAVLLVAVLVGLGVFVQRTLKAMTGVDDFFAYEPVQL